MKTNATDTRIKKLLADLEQCGWITEQVQLIRDELNGCDMGAAIEQIGAFDSDADLLKRQLAELRVAIVETCEAATQTKAGAA